MMSDIVLNYLLELIQNNLHYLVPMAVWLLAVWRVARLRGFNQTNYQDRVQESVSDTLKEQIEIKLKSFHCL